MTYEALKIYEGQEISRDYKTRSYTQKYLIMGLPHVDDLPNISNTYNLPKQGQNYSGDSQAYLKSLSIARDGTSNKWIATASYEYNIDREEVDPTAKNWEISIDNWTQQTPIKSGRIIDEYDDYSQAYIPITNSVGEDVEITTMDKNYTTIKLSKNIKNEDYDPETKDYVQDSINSCSMVIAGKEYPKMTLLMKSYTVKKNNDKINVFADDGTLIDYIDGYYSLDMEIVYNPAKWKLSIVDQGYNQLDDNDNIVPILNCSLQPVQVQIPLDGQGRVLDKDLIKSKQLCTLDFGIYNYADWSILNLPKEK